MRTAVRALVCLLILGCPPTDPPVTGPNDDTGAADNTTTTDPTTTDPTTGFFDTGFLDSGFDTEDPTMGEPLDPDADVAEMCLHLCMRVDQCDVDPGFESCPCDETLPEFCAAEWYDVTDCFDQTSCTDLQTFDGPCWALLEHAYLKCLYGEDGCDEYTTGSFPEPPPGTCAFGRECLDMPPKDITCEADTCTCTIDGAPAGMCPGDGVCESDDPAVMSAKIDECCG